MYKEFKSDVRENNVELHCHEVIISQHTDDGYTFKGYGIIKSTKEGALYIEFICLESSKRMKLGDTTPLDHLDDKQNLNLSGITLSGRKISASNLYIEQDFNNMISEGPWFYRISLRSFDIHDVFNDGGTGNKRLYFEFKEKCNIPKNRTNTTESTLGSKETSWNQTIIELGKDEVSIITHDTYSEVSFQSNDFDMDAIKECLLFYLSFTSGVLVQPYILTHCTEGDMTISVIGIDESLVPLTIHPPFFSDPFIPDHGKFSAHHDLFRKIFTVRNNNVSFFESISLQWRRVWHSCHSSDKSILMLTLSVAVEGILNDIFIPKISPKVKDKDLESHKEKITSAIEGLTDIDKSHLDNIVHYVSKWGNTHPKKALMYLIDEELITNQQKKAWDDMRNSSAHPRIDKDCVSRQKKDDDRIIKTLGLFYHLILLVYSYTGTAYTYKANTGGICMNIPETDLFS